jgi:drug/metabolite transporter (DMT)-like permease
VTVAPVVGGALCALAWGGADFIACYTSRAVGHLPVLLGMLIASCVALSLVAVPRDIAGLAQSHGWPFLIAYGVGFTVATALFYQALARGPVAVVSSIVAAFPAVNVLLAFTLGLRPRPAEWLAMFGVIAGVALVAAAGRTRLARERHPREMGVTVGLSASAALCFALTVAAGQEAGAVYGELEAVWAGRLVALPCCIGLLLVSRQRFRVPLRLWPVLAVQGTLDGAGYVFLLAASAGATSAVPAVVAASFSAVTVLLAWLVLREHVGAGQWLGIGVIVLGGGVLGTA